MVWIWQVQAALTGSRRIGEKKSQKKRKSWWKTFCSFSHMTGLKSGGLSSDFCFPVSSSMVQKLLLISSDKFSQLLLNPKCPPFTPPSVWEGAETGRKKKLIIPLQFNSWCHSSAAVQTDRLLCSSTRMETRSAAKAKCKMLHSGAISEAIWPKRGSVEWVVFQYADWPAPTPVSMSGSTTMQQMVSSLEKKAEIIKKVKLWERKHWCLTYPRSVRISQWYLTPGLNAVGAHLMLRLTNWKSPIHIKLSLQATYIPPSTPFISLLMTISEINQLKLTSTMTFSEFPSGNLLKEHSHSYPEHFLRRRYFGDF